MTRLILNCFTGVGRSRVSSVKKQDRYLTVHGNSTEQFITQCEKSLAITTCDCIKKPDNLGLKPISFSNLTII